MGANTETTCRVLILGEKPSDGEAMEHALRQAGFEYVAQRTQTLQEFQEVLEAFDPEVALIDCSTPDGSGVDALAFVRSVHPEVPVVIVAAPLGEEAAIELLKAGAKDYVRKDNLLRLVPAIDRAISVEAGIRARKAAEQAVRKANSLLATTERLAHIGGYEWLAADDSVTWSEETYRIYGYKPYEVTPNRALFLASVHPDDRDRVHHAMTASMERDAPFNIRFRIIRPDGSERTLHSRAEMTRDADGKALSLIGASHDITEYAQATADLRASEQRFRTLIEQAPEAILIHDFDENRFIDANLNAERLFGCSRAEIIKYGPMQFYSPDQPDGQPAATSFADHGAEALCGKQVTFTRRIIRADGRERLCEVTLLLLPSSQGHLSRASFVDITERSLAEQRLREEEEKFRGLVEQNVAGISIVREDGTIGYINPYFAQMVGYEPAEMIGRQLANFLPASEQQIAAEKTRDLLSGGIAFIQLVSAMKTKDGTTIDVIINASPAIFEGRRALIAVVLNITEQRRAERELAFERTVLATEHELTPDGILVVDDHARIISVNRRFGEIFQVPQKLLAAGKDIPVLNWVTSNVSDPAAFLERVRFIYAQKKESSHDELVLKDGRTLDRYSAPMILPGGGYLGRVWFFRDITERRATERSLQRMNRALRTLSSGSEALVRATSERQLLKDMCRIITDTGGYRLAWIGVAQHNSRKSVRIIAWSGSGAESFTKRLRVTWADTPHGRGTTGRAIRLGKPQVSQDLSADPSAKPWSTLAKDYGIAYCATLPIRSNGDFHAVLTIYATEPGAFGEEELAVLKELADDIGYGIRVLRERRQHDALNQRWQTSLEATVAAIANTVEMRDPYTAGHQLRVARLAAAIARELKLPEHEIHGIYLAGVVHDVGKINVPAEILNKPGRLSSIEFALIKGHAQSGYDILKGVDFPWPIADMVRQHHERLDGSGYPQGLNGDELSSGAKILAVADVVEAMMSHRPYRPALGIDVALGEIEKGKGTLYDAAAVDVCVSLFRNKSFSFNEPSETARRAA